MAAWVTSHGADAGHPLPLQHDARPQRPHGQRQRPLWRHGWAVCPAAHAALQLMPSNTLLDSRWPGCTAYLLHCTCSRYPTLQQVMALAAPVPGAPPSASDDPATQLAKKREYIAKQQRCLPSCCQAAHAGLHRFVGIPLQAASTVEASHILNEPERFMVALLMRQVAPVLAALRKVPGAGEQLPVRAVMHRCEAVVRDTFSRAPKTQCAYPRCTVVGSLCGDRTSSLVFSFAHA